MTTFEIECIESTREGLRDHYSKFCLEPLNQGQGTTLGNALRRTLLADLEGTAIVAVRIAGVSHEFSTIPGIREDVLEILLNLKEVVLKSQIGTSGVGRLRVQGPAIVTTNHLELPSEIELIDPNQYIATICGNNILEMEFRIETGKGYNLVERDSDESSIDFLQVDAIFMPVKKVNYLSKDIRSENNLIQEQLTLEVWTNGSIDPQDAVSQAGKILTELLFPLKEINFKPDDSESIIEDSKINQILIEELQLSVRAYNCLKRAQIHSVADLLDYSQEDLIEIKNFGQKSAEEVIDALQKRLGINLPKEKTSKSN
nr:RecName: Full=DNA-directed RNA polymerase subunit alpha; Short=PEP; AltName: Full=Plastid-encoded RNA polymerase subunit alpha; Short=RNA polymerase subunit alpha [Pyrenomonas salina]BDA97791.1 RNA polymerase alpha subunit [Rhodomonas sp. NIES-698]CAA46702.1 DNA-directed RNA polymerase alpha subunit [Pyrenomonas salina]